MGRGPQPAGSRTLLEGLSCRARRLTKGEKENLAAQTGQRTSHWMNVVPSFARSEREGQVLLGREFVLLLCCSVVMVLPVLQRAGTVRFWGEADPPRVPGPLTREQHSSSEE